MRPRTASNPGVCLILGLASMLLACPALALEKLSSAPLELLLHVGKGVVIDCPKGVSRVATSSPEIVDVVSASTTEVLFHAKALGQATIFIWSKSGERVVYDVTVEPNLEPLRKLVRETFPDEEIDIRASRDSLSLVGNASTQAVADRALALVSSSVKGAISNLKVAPPVRDKQVILHVKFAELNRTALAEIGANLLSTGAGNTVGRITTGQFASGGLSQVTGKTPGTAAAPTSFTLSDMLNIFAFRPDLNLGVMIRDLQTKGLLEILAEPNLVSTNGKEASFLAGGEFPVPVTQAGANSGAISVQFREYGIKLSFLPQVTTHDTIRLHVKPEVSSIDSGNGVTVSGLNIPALATRRIETDIELGTGQSFVIGGLIDDRVIENLSQVPGLSHVPIFGALFKSRSVSKSKTELIVVVTPEKVDPDTPRASDAGPLMPVPFLTPAETPKTKERK
ncbi:MAG TPA: pilus assembly protein N-terminal domain-containing protein [Bryobacteraceae bacterium]|nr:pilus assembly protein N-terminal domain-containing protein [Bryobacteraceae bacterium]